MATTELTKADEKQLEKFGEALEAGKLNSIDGMIEMGEAIKGARDLTAAAGCKGKFTEWMEAHRLSRTSAYRAIAVAENFRNCSTMVRFQDGTIPRLAQSELASKEAKQLAGSGKTITPEIVKELLEKHKPKKPKTAAGNGQAVPHSTAQEPLPEKVPPFLEPHDDESDGGYEPSEAKKPLDKLAKAIGEASRHWGDAKKILGASDQLQAVFSGIDQASIALAKFRKAFKRRPK